MFFKKKKEVILDLQDIDPELDIISYYGFAYTDHSNFYEKIDHLNDIEKTFLYAYLFFTETGSSGYNGVLYYCGKYFNEIIHSLNTLGLVEHANNVNTIASFFPNKEYKEELVTDEMEYFSRSLNYDPEVVETAIKNFIEENKDSLKLKR